MEEEKIEVDGYDTSLRNDRDKDGGGILIGIQNQLKGIITVVEKHSGVEESLWITLDNKQVAIRLGVIYAPQESRTSKEKYKEMYEHLEEQILLAKQKNQKLLLMGDFNCKIGNVIKGNTTEVSLAGRIFNKMIEKNKLLVLNGLERCNGIWTREEGGSRNILDYVIIDQGDEDAVVDMTVDEKKEAAPTTMEGSKSDHNVIMATLNWLIEAQQKKQAPKTIINKKGYQKIRKGIKDRNLVEIFNNDKPVEILYQEFKEEVNKLVDENKTEVKKKNPRKSIRILIKAKKDIKKKIKVERKNLSKADKFRMIARIKMLDNEIKEESFQQNKQKLDKVVTRLRGKNGVNIPSMWDIVKSIKRKKEEPPTAIRSKDGEIIEDPEKIRERYLEHFGDILKNVPAETEAEKAQENFIEEAFSRITSLSENKETRFTTMEEIQAAVKEMKRKKCKDKTGWNNEIVLETGEEMLECLLALINKMEEKREVPNDWNEVKVKTIGKKALCY